MPDKKDLTKAISDFLKAVAAIITSLAVIGAPVGWFLLPRMTEWVADIAIQSMENHLNELSVNSIKLAQLSEDLEQLTLAVNSFKNNPSTLTEPPLIFESFGNHITGGSPGSTLSLTWRFKKLHECGAPVLGLFFRDAEDQTHRFESISIVNEDGRGVAYSANPDVVYTLTYGARIPSGNQIALGRARGWVTLTYPQCPWAPTVVSPEVPFNIR